MATRRTEVPNDPRLNLLLQAYVQAQRTILAQVKAAIRSGDLTNAALRRRLLADVQNTLTKLGIETDREAADIIASMYTAAAEKAAVGLPGAHIEGVTGFSFNQVNREAVEALQESMLAKLQDARRTVGRQVADVFAREQRFATIQALLGAEGSPRSAAALMRRRLRDQGITGFVDKAGKRWTLEAYSQMAVRTVTREAVVAGAVNTIAAAGIDLVQVTFHASSCPICQPFESQIMSLNGDTGLIQGVNVVALELPPYHPNCTHSIAGYVPELAAL